MCGILGFNFKDKALLARGLKVTKHRGPDASGIYIDRNISLGHNRLSIIDLSKLGKQPMANENEKIWIVFNGEIYNYQELKENLKEKHSFKSNTDTEVMLHLYEEEGFDMVKKLQGMFAFCIYDSKKKLLFLARDRAGKKPLYYFNSDKKFMFCSEIKGILEDNSIKREVNLGTLPSYLAFRANTTEQTFFKDIKKLMPGCTMVYDLKKNKATIRKYWDLELKPENMSEEYFMKKIRALLEDAVRCRLMSDVPYGAYLSGGVDSGTVVALMSKYSSQPIKTFSVGFKEEAQKETDEARFLAKTFKCDHHELLIDSSSIKHLPKIIWHAEEPMADPTSIPTYLLSEYTKKYCTVILTGEGSDELFAGYPQYKFMKMHSLFLRKTPWLLRKIIPKILENLPPELLNLGFKFASALGKQGLKRFSNFANSNDYARQYLNQVAIFNEEEISELLGRKINFYSEYSDYFKNANSRNIVGKCQKLDFKGNMVDDLLMKIDKNTMAFSIEGRCPFLDYRLIELAAQIPDSMKLKGFTKDKYILREAVKDIIPKQTRKRKKRHFFTPIDGWFKNELLALRNELLSEEYINKQGIFNYNYIKKINHGFEKSKLFYSRQLWSLLTFQIWYKQFIEDKPVRILT